MADPKAHDTHRPAPNVPAKVTDATFEPVNSADPFWDNDQRSNRTRPPTCTSIGSGTFLSMDIIS